MKLLVYLSLLFELINQFQLMMWWHLTVLAFGWSLLYWLWIWWSLLCSWWSLVHCWLMRNGWSLVWLRISRWSLVYCWLGRWRWSSLLEDWEDEVFVIDLFTTDAGLLEEWYLLFFLFFFADAVGFFFDCCSIFFSLVVVAFDTREDFLGCAGSCLVMDFIFSSDRSVICNSSPSSILCGYDGSLGMWRRLNLCVSIQYLQNKL